MTRDQAVDGFFENRKCFRIHFCFDFHGELGGTNSCSPKKALTGHEFPTTENGTTTLFSLTGGTEEIFEIPWLEVLPFAIYLVAYLSVGGV